VAARVSDYRLLPCFSQVCGRGMTREDVDLLQKVRAALPVGCCQRLVASSRVGLRDWRPNTPFAGGLQWCGVLARAVFVVSVERAFMLPAPCLQNCECSSFNKDEPLIQWFWTMMRDRSVCVC
jgi:hypothetical protein